MCVFVRVRVKEWEWDETYRWSTAHSAALEKPTCFLKTANDTKSENLPSRCKLTDILLIKIHTCCHVKRTIVCSQQYYSATAVYSIYGLLILFYFLTSYRPSNYAPLLPPLHSGLSAKADTHWVKELSQSQLEIWSRKADGSVISFCRLRAQVPAL